MSKSVKAAITAVLWLAACIVEPLVLGEVYPWTRGPMFSQHPDAEFDTLVDDGNPRYLGAGRPPVCAASREHSAGGLVSF